MSLKEDSQVQAASREVYFKRFGLTGALEPAPNMASDEVRVPPVSITTNVGFYTYLIAAISYGVLVALTLTLRHLKPMGPTLGLACLITCVWAVAVTTGTTGHLPPANLILAIELLKNICWLFFLLQILSLRYDGSPWSLHRHRWPLWLALFALVTLALLLQPIPSLHYQTTGLRYETLLILWLLQALLGLVLLEQLFRNGSGPERWALKHLCIGLGILFVYDFFMYSEALLFRQLDAELWQARGLVAALITPLFAISMARNGSWHNKVTVSRQVAFHTVTLMGAGLYLLGMALIGYIIRFLGGTWGNVLQVGFLAAAGILLLVVLFSGKVRAQLRVLLSKHFFSYRYDYRDEWLKFTRALTSLDQHVPEGIIHTLAKLVDSPAGLLWARGDGQQMHFLTHWEMPPPDTVDRNLDTLTEWLERTDWVIDLDEWHRIPDLYTDLQLPGWLISEHSYWLIVPLVFKDRVEGVLVLKESSLKKDLNWEDRDLIKTAGRQAASHLAQYMASKALVEARQFDAFNRLSAYVIHDLKNILAQQSLMVSNAAKHRHNPAFIDDMIATVENSVNRMQRLMEQMRSGTREAPAQPVDLVELLREAVVARSSIKPAPQLDLQTASCTVSADRDRLYTVFNHLIQNAQEATNPEGKVTVRLFLESGRAKIEVEDSGCGMSEEFIRDTLFSAFESTKGLTGMGIGAFESREYVRQLGGDIQVQSEPGVGSRFLVTLPRPDRAAPMAEHVTAAPDPAHGN